MLYGYKADIEGMPSVIVTAGDTVEEFETFKSLITVAEPDETFWNDYEVTRAIDAIMNPLYEGLNHGTVTTFHVNDDQRSKYLVEYSIVALAGKPNARKYQEDMMNEADKKKEGSSHLFADCNRDKTIEEMLGLVNNDPWDARSKEKVEGDKATEEWFKKAKEDGIISDGSWTKDGKATAPTYREGLGLIDQDKYSSKLKGHWTKIYDMLKENIEVSTVDIFRAIKDDGYDGGQTAVKEAVRELRSKIKEGKISITDIHVKQNADGTFTVNRVLAKKIEGQVDEDLKRQYAEADAAKKAELDARGGLSPEDFENALHGDGRNDAIGMPVAADRHVMGDGVNHATPKKRNVMGVADETEEVERPKAMDELSLEELEDMLQKSEDEIREGKTVPMEDVLAKIHDAMDRLAADMGDPGALDSLREKLAAVEERVADAEDDVEDEEDEEEVISEDEMTSVDPMAGRPASLRERLDQQRGIFKGASLTGDEVIAVNRLPADVQNALRSSGIDLEENIDIARYPFNAKLAGNALLPYTNKQTVILVGLDEVGKMTAGSSGTLVVKPTIDTGWAIYASGKDGWVVKVEN